MLKLTCFHVTGGQVSGKHRRRRESNAVFKQPSASELQRYADVLLQNNVGERTRRAYSKQTGEYLDFHRRIGFGQESGVTSLRVLLWTCTGLAKWLLPSHAREWLDVLLRALGIAVVPS